MADENRTWSRQDEAFWRAHHEAWKRSDSDQRQYCEAEGLPLKAFGNWRAKFKGEPQSPERKLLYRRRSVSTAPSRHLRSIRRPIDIRRRHNRLRTSRNAVRSRLLRCRSRSGIEAKGLTSPLGP
jgi:hypothetical protein